MRSSMLGMLAAAAAVAGCQKAEEAPAAAATLFGWGGSKARYVGVGIYSPGALWTELARPTREPDATAAVLDDDNEVIVLIDSVTGQLRQCGNLSGYCIGMNPWSDPLDPAQAAPARLLKHAKQLREEAEAAADAEARKNRTDHAARRRIG